MGVLSRTFPSVCDSPIPWEMVLNLIDDGAMLDLATCAPALKLAVQHRLHAGWLTKSGPLVILSGEVSGLWRFYSTLAQVANCLRRIGLIRFESEHSFSSETAVHDFLVLACSFPHLDHETFFCTFTFLPEDVRLVYDGGVSKAFSSSVRLMDHELSLKFEFRSGGALVLHLILRRCHATSSDPHEEDASSDFDSMIMFNAKSPLLATGKAPGTNELSVSILNGVVKFTAPCSMEPGQFTEAMKTGSAIPFLVQYQGDTDINIRIPSVYQ